MTASADQCAREVLEVVPLVIRVIRAQMRRYRSPALSVPQFRALVHIEANPGASLSQAAEHIGITLPSASVLVDGLVQRNLVSREPHSGDRRRVTLTLTQRGKQTLQQSKENTQAFLAERLATLTEAERTKVAQAMHTLRDVFSPPQNS